jgi:hypothetical protein
MVEEVTARHAMTFGHINLGCTASSNYSNENPQA